MRPLAGAMLIVGLGAHAAAQPAVVPVGDEPHHRVVFENEAVRVFDVSIPPDETTLMHHHALDMVSLVLAGGDLIVQLENGEPAATRPATGAVMWASANPPYTHGLRNIGTSPVRVMAVELRLPPRERAVRPRARPHELVLENDRALAWHLVLGPKRSVLSAGPGVRIVRRGGTVQEGRLGQELTLESGTVQWLPNSVATVITNLGDTPIEWVEIELR